MFQYPIGALPPFSHILFSPSRIVTWLKTRRESGQGNHNPLLLSTREEKTEPNCQKEAQSKGFHLSFLRQMETNSQISKQSFDRKYFRVIDRR